MDMNAEGPGRFLGLRGWVKGLGFWDCRALCLHGSWVVMCQCAECRLTAHCGLCACLSGICWTMTAQGCWPLTAALPPCQQP